MSMLVISARLMVWEGGLDCTTLLTRVSFAGWVVAALSGEEPPLLDSCVESCQFQPRTYTGCGGIFFA
jgi:hypothetical protein